MKKILLVTPRSPFSKSGACEQDRAYGIEQFLRLGYDIRVITKTLPSDMVHLEVAKNKLGIKIIPVSYKFSKNLSFVEKLKKYTKRIINPFNWDGASYEYKDKEIQKVFIKELDEFKPDVVFFDYTYLWPLYKHVQKRKIPIIVRSHNFEPIHFLEEDGFCFLNLIKFCSKFLSELITIRKSDLIFSISPKEKKLYKNLGAKNVISLPLRGLPEVLKNNRNIKVKDTLNLFFMGSTYNVSHNRKALEFLIKEVAPEVERRKPGKFIFHILGNKIPKELQELFKENIIYEGYVENLDNFLDDMDIAVVPSLFGAGMQQKIFEPLARGIPTITSLRGLAGYGFEKEKHLVVADDIESFVSGILALEDIYMRKYLSKNSLKLSQGLFSSDIIDSVIHNNIKKLKK
jgi:hypothetical protein